MKNQYFGDVNDYRKYGLLRLLGRAGKVKIGVCWMLTNDKPTSPDGQKTAYLGDDKQQEWRNFDRKLYDFLRCTVHSHETESESRNVIHFNDELLPNGRFWAEPLGDEKEGRDGYFKSMWDEFGEEHIDLIFFDPDDGLANNSKSQTPLEKGHKGSSKKLFRDELAGSLQKGFSVLLYQQFDRTKRGEFVQRLGSELARVTDAQSAYSFWTPHVVFSWFQSKLTLISFFLPLRMCARVLGRRREVAQQAARMAKGKFGLTNTRRRHEHQRRSVNPAEPFAVGLAALDPP